jgi:hypothetical protein
MTPIKAHETLQRFAKENNTDVAHAAGIVLDTVKHLAQLLLDLVDFDIGEVPELDALDAAEGAQQIERHDLAWQRAIAEVGAPPRHFAGDTIAPSNDSNEHNPQGVAPMATELWNHPERLARLKARAVRLEAPQDIDTTLGHVAEELRDLIEERLP